MSAANKVVELAEATGFNNTSLTKYLSTLNRLGYIEKDERSKYFISDPMLDNLLKDRINGELRLMYMVDILYFHAIALQTFSIWPKTLGPKPICISLYRCRLS